MKKIAVIFGVLLLVGCVMPTFTPEQTAHLESADARMEKLAAKYPEIAEEFKAVKADIEASGATPQELAVYGVTGGVLGRSILHAGASFGGMIPGIGPLLAGLCSLLLAGSKGNKKK